MYLLISTVIFIYKKNILLVYMQVKQKTKKLFIKVEVQFMLSAN